jgi:hypothetical protein
MRLLSLSYRDGTCDDIIFSSEDSIEKACQETFDLLSITLGPEKKIPEFPSTLHTYGHYLPALCRHLGVTWACGKMQTALLFNPNIVTSVTRNCGVAAQCRRTRWYHFGSLRLVVATDTGVIAHSSSHLRIRQDCHFSDTEFNFLSIQNSLTCLIKNYSAFWRTVILNANVFENYEQIWPCSSHEGIWGGSRGTAPLILKLHARWIWVVNITPRTLYATERTTITTESEAGKNIKIYIKTAPTCFGSITIIRERIIWAC